tara:strand:- start:25 stop:534 length:510 start_codon:yes stop_codon:yes gene_type:complete
MVKQRGGKYQKGGMGAPGLGPAGMGAPVVGAPGMGAPGMGAPGMGSSLFGLGQLGNQDPYRSGAWSGQMDYTHGAMNGLNSMLGAQPRFHVLPELAQELSALLYNQNGLMGLGNAMMPYQNSGYGSMFSPQGGYGQYGLFGGKKSKKSKTRKAGAKKSNKKRKTKYNRK